jgi:hypothetical protein
MRKEFAYPGALDLSPFVGKQHFMNFLELGRGWEAN